MSYENRIDRAKTLIQEFNSQVSSENIIDIDAFLKKLKNAGGVSESMLQECTWEELQKAGLPVLLARKVAAIFREKDQNLGNTFVSERMVERMSYHQLIEKYDPKDKDSHVYKKLLSLSGGKRFIVVDSSGKINVESTRILLTEIRDGFPERDVFEVDGKQYEVVAVGTNISNTLVDENPLYPGRFLRPDGTCDQMNRSWSGVPLIVRQVLYLAVKNGELKVNIDKSHDTLDLALSVDAEKKVRTRYKKASIEIDKLIAINTAPTLKIRLTSKSNNIVQNPFNVGNTTY